MNEEVFETFLYGSAGRESAVSVQAGICNFDGQPVNRRFLESVSNDLAEYAFDSQSIHGAHCLGMLYRPFHTTLESRFERQPCRLGNGGLMTWDGRLDNRDELIDVLGTVMGHDMADAEIAAAAFNRWETDSFQKLIGDWALVIWTGTNREILLARDFVGTRSLFYWQSSEQIAWCTYLKPLTHYCKNLTICNEYVAGFLASHPDADLTPYCEIRAVPPGAFVSKTLGKLKINSYWQVQPQRIRYKADCEYEEHYRHLLRQAVRRRLRSPAPILAELSGGLDSSSVVLMADDILASEGETPILATLSYHDSQEPEDDDVAYMEVLEQKRGKQGVRLDLAGSGDSFSLDYPSFEACPGFESRTELHARLQSLIRNSGYRVALSGFGGDEINAQTLNVSVVVADRLTNLEIAQACKELVDWSLQTRRPWVQLLWRSIIELLPGPFYLALKSAGRKLTWIEPQFAQEQKVAARQLHAANEPFVSPPALRDWRQTIVSIRNALAVRHPSMLEKRYPYLDRTLIDFVTSIPLNQLLRPGQRRSLMRRALKELLPQEILDRKTKGTAVRCFCTTLQKHWNKIEMILASPISSQLRYINREKLHASLLAMRNGQVPSHSVALLRALSLELWLQDAVSRGIFHFPDSSITQTAGESETQMYVHSRR